MAELKLVMEQMNEERDDQTNPTAPSTPGFSKFNNKEENGEFSNSTQSSSSADDIAPSYPTSFTHLLHPVLRTDLAAFDDFTTLLRTSKAYAAGSRVSSGSYGGIGLGLGLGGYTAQAPSSAAPSNGSTTSITAPATMGSSPASPTTPASAVSTGSGNGNNSIIIPLKETRFYKRALAEDIEPTLRLDTAPGLSWLARRTVLNAMCEGSLVVEPMPSSTAKYNNIFTCSLCGEARKDPRHARTHRFRTSESDSAQRYPLCKYCLGRVRSSCDFLGFLRVLKDGHWKTDDEESERAAWEESVRLREQMFWCRIGGGVVPASTMLQSDQQHAREKSPRMSEEERKDLETMKKLNEEADLTGQIIPRDVTPVRDSMKSDITANEASIALEATKNQDMNSTNTVEDLKVGPQDDTKAASRVVSDIDASDEAQTENIDMEKSNRDSTQSLSVGSDGQRDEKRLSITIPGSFE